MRVQKTFRFEAAHRLPKHPGKCRHLHGHSYRMDISVQGRVSPSTGFVVDFGDLKRIMKPVVDCLDHCYLNILLRYPSAEALAWRIWDSVFAMSERVSVVVYETESSYCSCDVLSAPDLGTMDIVTIPSLEEIGPVPVPIEYEGSPELYVQILQEHWQSALETASLLWREVNDALDLSSR